MKYSLTDLAEKLKAAREAKGLSQRELGQLVGIPQSHISKIESGNVDMRVSSLTELARALNLELTLVPRRALPAVKSIAQASVSKLGRSPTTSSALRKKLKSIEKIVATLAAEQPTNEKLAQFLRQAKEFQKLSVPDSYLQSIKETESSLRRIEQNKASWANIAHQLEAFTNLRNSLVHDISLLPQADEIRPAYSLDDNDDG